MIIIPVAKPNRQGWNDIRSIYVLQVGDDSVTNVYPIPPTFPIMRQPTTSKADLLQLRHSSTDMSAVTERSQVIVCCEDPVGPSAGRVPDHPCQRLGRDAVDSIRARLPA
jgi:hypothetical protein